MPIRVLIVDDHAVVRQGLRMFLQVDDELVLLERRATAKKLCAWRASSHPTSC